MAARRTSSCPSGSAFFGLTTQYRASLFTMIHNIVFHGKGGYDWETVYNMPIWLRKFTYKSLLTFYEERNKEDQKQYESAKNRKIAKPAIKPTYTTKASR